MFNLSDTIAAICTPQGTGGLAAIRISGSASWKVLSEIFYTSKSNKLDLESLEHMKAIHGFIKDEKGIVVDEVVVIPYKSPKSFTAEDVVEIFCHGGVQIPHMILDLCLSHGARSAGNGEFTFRAFVNGRIDLTEAEAVNELINADNSKAVYATTDALTGSLKNKVQQFREKLYLLLTSIEGSIEFPMDVGETSTEEKVKVLNEINQELKELIETSKDGRMLRQGVKVSIIGEPNVGKSSLLNMLLENERAIVTDNPGTTRDVIEEKIIIKGWPIVLIDTAGIRENKDLDLPEHIGIERTKSALEKSDLAICVLDLNCLGSSSKILEKLNGKPKLIVGNKVDLIEKSKNGSSTKGCDILISARNGTNIDELKAKLVEKVKTLKKDQASDDIPVYINERQKELLIQCSSSIDFAIKVSNDNAPEDLIADELKKSISKLDEISGAKVNEETIASIFKNFCIGK